MSKPIDCNWPVCAVHHPCMKACPRDATLSAAAEAPAVKAKWSDPVETILRAMARNYAGGHSWDHLDAATCVRAAEEIERLRVAQPKADSTDLERSQRECDEITELNHRQWLALENVRLLAARHRKEEWAQHMLRFCAEAGATGSPLKADNTAAAPEGRTDCQCVIAMDEGAREPRLVSWNVFPIGSHRLYLHPASDDAKAAARIEGIQAARDAGMESFSNGRGIFNGIDRLLKDERAAIAASKGGSNQK